MVLLGAIYCLITYILLEMSHPLRSAMMVEGLTLWIILWFVGRPKEQWAQTPFGKVKRVNEASLPPPVSFLHPKFPGQLITIACINVDKTGDILRQYLYAVSD
jgi:hypothetical protein